MRFPASLLFILLINTAATCNKAAAPGNCFKGKLVIKGACTNYVIKVLEGNTAGLKVEKSWTDEADGKVYENVFALASRCNFPDMEEGDEFYFTVTGVQVQNCMQCTIYRAVPKARNFIVVQKTSCF